MTTAGPASNGMEAAIMHSMDRDLSVRMASSDLGVPAIATASGSHSTTANWRKALDNVVPACVVLKVTQTRSFDTEAASSSYATGFVVDKVRGLILTNRHVVTPGPVTAEAIFLDREEVPVLPVYYDPVHDFGFMRFEPSKVHFMALHEVPLAPKAAAVGLEVRVVGNDSGEKISILAGTLARLDRDAPHYGLYLQAGSGSKGGSSGSPVVDCNGQAVALNAGGKDKASSAFYLPLERVVRALHLIQEGTGARPNWQWGSCHIPRGDLQTTFLFKGFDEARRLGLNRETEAEVRAALAEETADVSVPGAANSASTGMLVVDSIVPGSFAESLLEPGDIIIQVESKVVTHFLALEDILDSSVGATVTLNVERGGRPLQATIKVLLPVLACHCVLGRPQNHEVNPHKKMRSTPKYDALQVQDLHAITPACFLEASGCIIHSLSYQQARNCRLAVGQVYLAEAGYLMGQAGVPKHSILTSLAGLPTPDLGSFARVLGGLASGSRPTLQYFTVTDRHRKKNAVLHLDYTWYGQPKLWTRDDASGYWTSCPVCAPEPTLLEPRPEPSGGVQPQALSCDSQTEEDSAAAEAAASVVEEADADVALDQLLRQSLVLIEVEIPHVALMDGVHAKSFEGNGVIVHASDKLGLVLVDRSTVPVGGGNITLSFGAYPDELPGRVRFLHPLHNFAIISYDPTRLSHQAQQEVQAIQLSEAGVKKGEQVQLCGLTQELRLMRRSSRVTSASHALKAGVPSVPRFRPVHEEVIELDHDFGDTFSGVLTTSEGHMTALYANYNEQSGTEDIEEYCRGISVAVIKHWLNQVCNMVERGAKAELGGAATCQLTVGTLDAELEPLILSKAAQHGLAPSWVTRLARFDPHRRQVLRVRGCVAHSHAAEILKDGDLVLAVNGQPVTSYSHVEDIVAACSLNATPYPVLNPTVPQKDNSTKSPIAAVTSASGPQNDLSRSAGKASTVGEGNELDRGQQQQPAMLIKAARNSPRLDSQPGPAETQKGSLEMSQVALTIFRAPRVEEVRVQLGREDGLGTCRLIHWCGAMFQAPHRPVRELGFAPAEAGVYVSRWHHGSPAHRYSLYALHWLTQLNGQPVVDLDAFVAIVKTLPDKSFARLKLCQLETTKTKVLSIKLDLRYWPTVELKLDPVTATWSRHLISPQATQSSL
ncbi:TPA: hypothetical protein ACH3X2_007259 [Trebouxia sp. C0005]